MPQTDKYEWKENKKSVLGVGSYGKVYKVRVFRLI